MSYNQYENQRRRHGYGASTRRSTLGYWVPLALTVTVATIGLAAWIWQERSDDDEYDNDRKGDARPSPVHGGAGPSARAYTQGQGLPEQQGPFPGRDPSVDDPSILARMSGALRRTPSPQQMLDGASRRVAAGVAAAGAVVGVALSSIREEDKKDFEDHSRWSQEASLQGGSVATSGPPAQGAPTGSSSTNVLNRQAPVVGQKGSGKRKTVAIVVSAETKHHNHGDGELSYHEEHASILSHLPEHIDDDSRVFIMIYDPDLTQHPLAAKADTTQTATSITSSYSNIGHEELQSQGDDSEKPTRVIDSRPLSPSRSKTFNSMYAQAQALVDKDTMIMPFTTPTGYVHLLRHIAPEVVYVQATLSGPNGDAIKHIGSWVGQVVLVVGDETGHGGLVDSEDERGHSGDERQDKWWQDDPKIGLGKGIEVVEGLRVGEDWRRRVRGHD